MKLVMMGPSGAGKGTQAKIISKKFNIPHISTGDILRRHIADKTEIGLAIEDTMDTGTLVPDDIVIDLVGKRISMPDCGSGYILDGFPRNLLQARVLRRMDPELEKVVCIQVNDDEIIRRMSGRYSCPDCGAVFHIESYPPKKSGVCDGCGAALVQREDDKAATVANRLKIYHEMTEPIIKFFNDLNLLSNIDGYGGAEHITAQILGVL